MKPSDKPTAQQRTQMINWLTSRGLNPSVVSTIVSAGKSRAEIKSALVERLKDLPKAQAQGVKKP